MTASLFVIQGRDQGTRFELDSHSVSFPLGRDTGNQIQLHDTEVSRRHAEFRRNGDMFLISDLGSSNGTFVNNQRIQQQELSSGDQVQIGRTVMLFTGSRRSAVVELGRAGEYRRRRFGRAIADLALHQPGRGKPHLLARPHDRHGHIARAMARPRTQQSADHVSHGAGREPYARYRSAAATDHAVDLRMGRSRSRLHHAPRSGDEAASSPRCAAIAKGIVPTPVAFSRRTHHDQPDDSRLRHASAAKACSPATPGRTTAWTPRPASCMGSARGDLRADAGALRRGRRDLHRHFDSARPRIGPDHRRVQRQQIHRRASQADDRHRPSGGAGGRRHELLFGDGAGRAAGGRRPDDRHRYRITSRTFCKASAAAAI